MAKKRIEDGDSGGSGNGGESRGSSTCTEELWTAIRQSERAVAKAEIEISAAAEAVSGAKSVLKAAESKRDTLVRELLDLISDAESGQGRLGFEDQGGDRDGDWREVEICELELSDHEVGVLHEADIETLGDLASFSEKHPLTKIKGVGEALADKIAKAAKKYWGTK